MSKAILKYWSYMADIREAAEDAGISIPLDSPKDEPLKVEVYPFFENGIHPDPGNVEKGVKDALFYKAKNGDKHTAGEYPSPMYDKENPRVLVLIKRCRRNRGPKKISI